jgi:hypothetical protein
VPLAALIQGVPLAGRPPAMALGDGCVSAIYTVKVSRKGRIYQGDRVKIYAYAAAAERLGILCPDARLAVVVAPEPLGLQELLRLLPEPSRPRPLRGSSVSLHVLAHDPEAEAETLAPLLAYWRGERPPRPRPGAWCSSCPYRDRCPAASSPHGRRSPL